MPICPGADTLPEAIRPLARRNALGLRPERFKADCQGLVTALKESLSAAEQERAARAERKAAEAARLEAEAQADHMVVCGAEQLTEAALKTLAVRGRRIVSVAPNFDPTRRKALEGLGLPRIEADPFQAVTFSALNLARASALFLTHGDDLANLDLAMVALAAASSGRPIGRRSCSA